MLKIDLRHYNVNAKTNLLSPPFIFKNMQLLNYQA